MEEENRKYLLQILLHIFIGVTLFYLESLSKLYFALIITYFIYKIYTTHKNRAVVVLTACSYIVSCEVLLRMTGGSVSYEGSKYTVIAFLIIGIFFNSISRKSYPYVLYIMLLVPGIVVASFTLDYETVFRKAIAFNLSGPVCLGIAALFCYKVKISIEHLDRITKAIVLPIIAQTIYLFIYNPSIKDVLSGTQSNFGASGGFGPNQVSTVLGLGMFVLTVRYVMFSKNMLIKIVNLTLLALVSYRAIITFSRGGVIAGVIIIIAFLGIYFLSATTRKRKQVLRSISVLLVASIAIWFYTSIQTLGFIDKRYTNKDAAGRVKEDASTGRVELLTSEFQEFFENPFIGVGVGKVKEARLERIGIEAASHNEMSRILAEHGLFGVCAFLILLLVPLIHRSRNRSNYLFYSFYLFWFLTINHSSMRIAAPAFIYALCLLNIKYEKPIVHRKQIS